MTTPKKILVVEDEDHIAIGVMLNLKLQGFLCQRAHNGEEALKMWKSFHPDLIVLDLMMPKIDGHEVIKKIREENERLPILILSAKNEVESKVKCLKDGVDDYLSKPFDLDEFLLRVDRLIKRSQWNQESSIMKEESFSFDHCQIDFVRKKAMVRGSQINLTEQELKILNLFIQKKGIPIHRKELLEVGWGYDPETNSRTVDVFMVRLRKYFEEDPKRPKFFKSIRAVGYVFDPDGSE